MVKRGEIYWLELPQTTGSEQAGRRPVLIVQNDVGNRSSPVTIVA
ncbi:MAG: type II toxin-antitoxin system PemK/MazF family toxin, partial [Chloroflexota bacterium]